MYQLFKKCSVAQFGSQGFLSISILYFLLLLFNPYPQILFGSLLVKDGVIINIWHRLARGHSRYTLVLKLVGQLKKDRVQEILVIFLK